MIISDEKHVLKHNLSPKSKLDLSSKASYHPFLISGVGEVKRIGHQDLFIKHY